jgi:hypothetical protein
VGEIEVGYSIKTGGVWGTTVPSRRYYPNKYEPVQKIVSQTKKEPPGGGSIISTGNPIT